MDYTNIFRLANLGIGGLMIVGGISHFFTPSIHAIIVGVFVILFGAAVLVLELVPNIPPYIPKYASFLFSFLGRGAFYIFIGALIVEEWLLQSITGAIIGIVGIGYVALEFVPQIEPPSNMREAEAGWGAEQV